MNCFQFVCGCAFDNPIQRLIMLRVLMSGSSDGEGERVIDHQVLADFCCCSKQAIFRETPALKELVIFISEKLQRLLLMQKPDYNLRVATQFSCRGRRLYEPLRPHTGSYGYWSN